MHAFRPSRAFRSGLVWNAGLGKLTGAMALQVSGYLTAFIEIEFRRMRMS